MIAAFVMGVFLGGLGIFTVAVAYLFKTNQPPASNEQIRLYRPRTLR